MHGQEPTGPSRFRFGLFELDLRRGELRSNGRPVRLSPQPSKLLTLLVSRPGELILQLSRMSAERLAVIARTSALAYKGSRKTVQQIARELDVSYVVEGPIRSSAGGRVRISVTLVHAADQSAIWADAWERDVEALLPLQRDVAAHVTRALALH